MPRDHKNDKTTIKCTCGFPIVSVLYNGPPHVGTHQHSRDTNLHLFPHMTASIVKICHVSIPFFPFQVVLWKDFT